MSLMPQGRDLLNTNDEEWAKIKAGLKKESIKLAREREEIIHYLKNAIIVSCRYCLEQPKFLVKGGSPFWNCTATCNCGYKLVSEGKDGDHAKGASIDHWNKIHG